MDIITKIYFFCGAGIILAFAVNYFNQPGYRFADEEKGHTMNQEDFMLEPALPKYLTDRLEYNFYLLSYILVTELIYLLLVLFLPDLISSNHANSEPLSLKRQNIILAALIITGIAPNLPYIRQLLERSKLYLHNKAQIPKKGREVYYQIKKYQPHFHRAEIAKILEDECYLKEESGNDKRIDLCELDFKAGKWTIEGRWAKLSYLLYFADLWSKTPPFRNYIGNRELQFDSIKNAYDNLQEQMSQYRLGKYPEAEIVKLNTMVDATMHRTYRLISCLLYLAGKSDTAVEKYLDQLGYASSERKDFPIPWKNIAYIIIAITGSILMGSFIIFVIDQIKLFNFNNSVDTNQIMKWAGYAIPFITFPVIWVLCIKRFLSSRSEAWPVVTENSQYNKISERPWHLYLIIAFSSYLVGVIVLLILSAIVKKITGDTFSPDETIRSVAVWSSLVFVTSIFAAYRLDSAPRQDISLSERIYIKGMGAIFQGFATFCAMYFSFMHQYNGGNLNPFSLTGPEKIGRLVIFSVICFFLGILLHLSFQLGALRQRRKSYRRRIQRQVIICSGQNKTEGTTVNISNEGVLVKSDEYIYDESSNIELTNESGVMVPVEIKKRRGYFLHIHFPDIAKWYLLQKSLEIPSIA
jgi:hypothetical protein